MRKEALLYLHEVCNYSCSYCMLGDSNYKRSESKANTRERTIKIIDFFNKRKEWSILITGGEPTEHPYFIELVEELTKENYIRLDTNNSMDGDKLEEFISRINSNRIEYIQCSLHEIDETPDRLEQYVDRIKKLKENGHKVFVTYVATPKRIPSIPHLYNRFYENNIPFVIVPLRTPEYPKSYTEKEREILDQYMSSSIHRGYLEIDERKVLGEKCNSDHTRININGINGNIRGCWRSRKSIGNIYDDILNLSETHKECELDSCTYYYEPHMEVEGLLKKDIANILNLNKRYEKDLYIQFIENSIRSQ